MAIYDYVCGACDHVVEVVHGIHDQGPRYCPNCGVEGRMRKTIAAPAVHFKGSGWAKKDRSATATPGRSKKAEPASSPAGETATSAASESTKTSASPAGSDAKSGSSGSTAGSNGGGD